MLISGPEMLPQVALRAPPAFRLLAHFWPGPLTLILPARPDLPPLLTGGTGAIGVRQPGHILVCRLLAALGFPVTGTSANRSGRPPLTEAAAVARELVGGPDPGGWPHPWRPAFHHRGPDRDPAPPGAGRGDQRGHPQGSPSGDYYLGDLMAKETAVVGIDLGGTNVRLALVTPGGRILARWDGPRPLCPIGKL